MIKWSIPIPKSQQVGHASEAHLNGTTEHKIELSRTLLLLLQTLKGLRAAWRGKGGEEGNFVEVTGRGGIYPTATIETDGNTVYALQMLYLLALQQGTTSCFIPPQHLSLSPVHESLQTHKARQSSSIPTLSLAHSFSPSKNDRCLQSNPQWILLWCWLVWTSISSWLFQIHVVHKVLKYSFSLISSIYTACIYFSTSSCLPPYNIDYSAFPVLELYFNSPLLLELALPASLMFLHQQNLFSAHRRWKIYRIAREYIDTTVLYRSHNILHSTLQTPMYSAQCITELLYICTESYRLLTYK